MTENLLQQNFSPLAPNRSWAGDITYIRTTAGWRYLAVWIDLYSRRVVGWAMGATMEATLVLEALNKALGQRCGGELSPTLKTSWTSMTLPRSSNHPST